MNRLSQFAPLYANPLKTTVNAFQARTAGRLRDLVELSEKKTGEIRSLKRKMTDMTMEPPRTKKNGAGQIVKEVIDVGKDFLMDL